MLNLYNLLDTPVEFYSQYKVVCMILILLMGAAALTAIILVLLQPANSSGIDALGGSSETFFGKNKGQSSEEKLKKWTWICLAVLVILSIVFFVIPLFVS
jgi:preprotein translocase subunit SecG